jgi:hypothetical protein
MPVKKRFALLIGEVGIGVEVSIKALRDHAQKRSPVLFGYLLVVWQARLGYASSEEVLGQQLFKVGSSLNCENQQLVIDLQLALTHHAS